MIINLISNPRNISTAFMYSFAQRSDTTVVDEPFYAYYLEVSGVDHPGREDTLKIMPRDLATIRDDIQKEAPKTPVYFIKNMAHHLIEADFSFIKAYKNLFLIRNPYQLIASFAQNIAQPSMQDIGLARQYELYHMLSEEQNSPPLILDSGELLKDPEKVLSLLCQKLDIPFEKSMLNWEAGPRPEDGAWAPYWYANVHQSTGFSKQKTSSRQLPENCLPLYEEARPLYEKLYEHSIRL